MLKIKQWIQLIAFLVGVASASCLVPSEAAPPGGGVPAGKVFYTWNTALTPNSGGEYLGFWSMNADGSGKQLLAYQPSWYSSAQLSHLVHQGHRWFLEFRSSSTAGNGVAVFAVRDDGDPDYSVVLADPAGLSLSHVRWAKDDSFISIAAMPEITNPDGTHSYDPDALHRIYAAEIAFDPITDLPALTTPLVVVAEGEQPGYPDIRNHDWSPAGDALVYQQQPNPGESAAKVSDLLTGTTNLLASNAYAPVWSPDGSRIAYKLFNEGLYVINPNGSGLLKITNGSADDTAGWSPDGKHVLFHRLIVKSIKGGYQEYHSDVFRVPATGGTAVNLTKDIDGYARAIYWR